MSTTLEYELRVQHFLVANGVTFVSPQFGLPFQPLLDSGGSNPDFVAIRPKQKECFVVEVTVSGSPSGLVNKINSCDKQWLRALRAQLICTGVIDASWKTEILVFMRRDKIQWFRRKLHHNPGVHIWPIDYVLQHWLWPPEARRPEFDLRHTDLASSSKHKSASP
jgi:hypothetical protein